MPTGLEDIAELASPVEDLSGLATLVESTPTAEQPATGMSLLTRADKSLGNVAQSLNPAIQAKRFLLHLLGRTENPGATFLPTTPAVIPPAVTTGEKIVDAGASLAQFAGDMFAAKQLMPTALKGGLSPSAQNILVMTAQSSVRGNDPAGGAALGTAFELIGKIPGASIPARIGKTFLGSGVLGGATALGGGDIKDVAIAAAIPPLMHTFFGTGKPKDAIANEKISVGTDPFTDEPLSPVDNAAAQEKAVVLSKSAQKLISDADKIKTTEAKRQASGFYKPSGTPLDPAAAEAFARLRGEPTPAKAPVITNHFSDISMSSAEKDILATLDDMSPVDVVKALDAVIEPPKPETTQSAEDQLIALVGEYEARRMIAEQQIKENAPPDEVIVSDLSRGGGDSGIESLATLRSAGTQVSKENTIPETFDLEAERVKAEKALSTKIVPVTRKTVPVKKVLSSPVEEFTLSELPAGDKIFIQGNMKSVWTVGNKVGELVQLTSASGEKKVVRASATVMKEKAPTPVTTVSETKTLAPEPVMSEADRIIERQKAFGLTPEQQGYSGQRRGMVLLGPQMIAETAAKGRDIYRALRERHAELARLFPRVARGAVDFAQFRALADEDVRRFIKTISPQAGKPFGLDTLQRFWDVGLHQRAQLMREYAGDAAQQGDLKTAKYWSDRAKNIPQFKTDVFADEVAARPDIQEAIRLWNTGPGQTIEQLRGKYGLRQTPIQPGKVFLNLPSEMTDKVRKIRRLINSNPAFAGVIDPAQSLESNPVQGLKAVVRSHYGMDSAQGLKTAIKASAVKPADLITEFTRNVDKVKIPSYYTMVNGVKTKVLPVEFAGKNPETVLVPEQVAKTWEVPEKEIHDLGWFDTVVGKVTGLSLAVGATVPHSYRLAAHVALQMGKSGETNLAMIPWLGSRVAAVAKVVDMHGKWGQIMGDLNIKTGSDRGQGYLQRHLTKGKVGKFTAAIGEDLLFHPDRGVDVLARRAVIDTFLRIKMGDQAVAKLRQGVENGTITREGFHSLVEGVIGSKGMLDLGRGVNNSIGWANTKTRSSAMNWASKLFPFIASESGKIPTEIRSVLTLNVTPSVIAKQMRQGRYGKALTTLGTQLASGPLGTYLVMEAINYALSGHHMWDNEEGHALDIQIGDNTYLSSFDPVLQRGARVSGVKDILNEGLSGVARAPVEAVNEAMSAMAPLAHIMFSGLTLLSSFTHHLIESDWDVPTAAEEAQGLSPYITKGGKFMSVGVEGINPLSIGSSTLRATLGHGEQDVDQAVIDDLVRPLGVQLKHDD